MQMIASKWTHGHPNQPPINQQETIMFRNLFQSVLQRLQGLLYALVVSELETELQARHAERQAELLRRASAFEQEGLADLARSLRQQAGQLLLTQPGATTLPAVAYLTQDLLTVNPGQVKPEKELSPVPALKGRKSSKRN
jgi:hypothetical protein